MGKSILGFKFIEGDLTMEEITSFQNPIFLKIALIDKSFFYSVLSPLL